MQKKRLVMSRVTKYFSLMVVMLSFVFIAACATPAPAPSPTPSPTPTPIPPSTSPTVIELKFAHQSPPQSTKQVFVFTPWAKRVEELTKGQVKITFYGSESLLKGADMYNGVVGKVADIVEMIPGNTPGVFPLTDGLGLPLLFRNNYASCASYYELIDKYMKDTEYNKVKVLYTYNPAPANILSKRPVKTLEDLKGVKVALAMGESAVNTFKTLGAAPLPMIIPEIYNALDRGMADAFADSYSAAFVFKIQEVTKYRTTCGLLTNPIVVVMNRTSWDSLPANIQKIFVDNNLLGLEMSAEAGRISEGYTEEYINKIKSYDKEKGNPEFYDLPQEELDRWIKVLNPLYEDWITKAEAKGLPGRAFFNDVRAIADKYNKQTYTKGPTFLK